MSKIDLKKITIKSAAESFRKGDYTAVELASAYLEQIKQKDTEIRAYLEIYDDVLEQAKKADERIKNGSATELTGIPIAVKDVIFIKGKKLSAASKILENYVAPYNSTVIEKLIEAGVVFIGRTNMDEFAMGSSTENSAFGPTKNPYDTSRVPGGTSGGSAAAVAADMTLVALGTDTGGSVRQPSALCGLVGLKPTYGRVSRYGLIAVGSSLDQIGPLAKTVTDVETLFNKIKCGAVADPMDSTSITDPSAKQHRKIIGVPRDQIDVKGVDEDVKANFWQSIDRLKSLGYEIKDISLPNVKYSLPVFYLIQPAEVSTNLARFDGVKYGLHHNSENLLEDYKASRGEGFGLETRRRIILGTYVLSAGYYDAYYNKAIKVRALIAQDFINAFKDVDFVATPTTPSPAFKIGEKSGDPVQMYLEDIYTVTANIVGVPAINLPAGFVEREGKMLPLGLQLTAPHQREDWLFAVGKEFLNE